MNVMPPSAAAFCHETFGPVVSLYRVRDAAEAIALFVYRIVREIGSLAAALGGLDALIFTGGIGENDRATRADVAQGYVPPSE